MAEAAAHAAMVAQAIKASGVLVRYLVGHKGLAFLDAKQIWIPG